MTPKAKRENRYQNLLTKSLNRHAKDIKGKPMNSFVKEIDWSKLNNFFKTKHNEQSSRTNDSDS